MAKVLFFANDIAEPAQIRRIGSVRQLGHDVASVSFRRDNANADFRPDWPDIPLGRSKNERFARRAGQLVGATRTLWRYRAALRDSHVWIARNFDMLMLAQTMRRLNGQRDVKLIYECLDIHTLFTLDTAVGSLMRWAERRALSAIDLLIISSPAFWREYFGPMQGYAGPTALLENKIWFEGVATPRPNAPPIREPDAPIRLGWVGSLRCPRSLDILTATAEALGNAVEVLCWGSVHRHALPGFDAAVANHPNIHYGGAFRQSGDLAEIYRSCDLVWSQDLWQSGANSDWLLPNRIYEASYFGCPSIALAGSETGRRIARDGLGFTLEDASAEALTNFLRGLTRRQITLASAQLLSIPETAFRMFPAELRERLATVLPVEAPDTAKRAEEIDHEIMNASAAKAS